eukprot:jgi/Chlat1/5090/Chrsp33S05018
MKAMRLHDMPAELCRHEIYQPLQAIWEEYAQDLLQGCSDESALLSRLMVMDRHGAVLRLTHARQPTYVGLEGIVVMETACTFRLVTKHNKLQVVPKQGAVFEMQVGLRTVVLYGKQLLQAPRGAAKRSRANTASMLPTIEL